MKCELKRSYGSYDTGPDFKLKLKPLMLGFMDVVAKHSGMSGCGIEWLLSQKKAWVLHRLFVHIHQMPETEQDLTFVTWHKGVNGFRAYRDYEIWRGYEKLVSAASLWLFIDTETKKILKAPQESHEWYSVEPDNALTVDIDAFKPVKKLDYNISERITIRSSDFDPIGHVNNAVYLDFLETAVDRCLDRSLQMEKVMIQFNKEITEETCEVEVGIKDDKDGFQYCINSGAGIHAFGEFEPVRKNESVLKY